MSEFIQGVLFLLGFLAGVAIVCVGIPFIVDWNDRRWLKRILKELAREDYERPKT